MYSKFANLQQNHYLQVDDELRADCLVWLKCLTDDRSVCSPFIDFSQTLIANKINFFTDASALAKLGFGDVFGGHWMYSQWEKSFIEIHNPCIEFLELYAVTITIDLWAEKLQKRRVTITLCTA